MSSQPEIDPSSSRDRILQAATKRFMKNGYAGTSLKTIAEDVGISTPALYWHFKSKEEIAFVSVEMGLVDFISFVRRSVVSSDPKSQLKELVTAHVTWQLEQADAASAFAATVGMRQMATEFETTHRDRIVGLQREYLDLIREILVSGKSAGVFEFEDPVTTGFAILTMCEYVHTWFNPHGALTPADVAQRFTVIALAAVRAAM